MKYCAILFAVSVLASPLQAAEPNLGKDRFKAVCMACHKLDMGPQMVAPPIFGVRDHYLRVHPGKAEFVQAVVDWVQSPDNSKSLMPGAVRRFNLMPPLPLPEEELQAIASFLYEAKFDEPGWYKEHFEAEHGRQ